jgi:hypothetical protein
VHASLYNYELYKLQHGEAERLATEQRWTATVRRANRRTRRALWTRSTQPRRATARGAVTN